MESQPFSLIWQEIEISITYVESWSKAYKDIWGYQLAHMKIHAEEPLPITQTGFRSIFLHHHEVMEEGGVTNFVNAILEEASLSKSWQEHLQQRNQLSLF